MAPCKSNFTAILSTLIVLAALRWDRRYCHSVDGYAVAVEKKYVDLTVFHGLESATTLQHLGSPRVELDKPLMAIRGEPFFVTCGLKALVSAPQMAAETQLVAAFIAVARITPATTTTL